MKNILLLSFLLISHISPLHSADKEKSYNEANSITLLLPVNHLEPKDKRVNVRISIPTDFKPVFSMAQSLKTGFYEFTPRSENDPNNWSEIITAGIHVGKKIPASDLNNMIKQGVFNNASNVVIVHENSNTQQSYTMAQLAVSYTKSNRQELLVSYVYSGPYDCSYIQYSTVLTKDMTQKQALEKIDRFAQNNISIIRF